MISLGQLIRDEREKRRWPQRKLAYQLDIDVSVLSRMENENKFPKKRIPEIISKVSELFGIDEIELKKIHLSDEIANILMYENKYEEILKASEAKVHYGRQKNSQQTDLKF
ncbi:MAG: helix-turn-helix transcriptional regulator [Flavobacteriaceae bacterium]|nr:helix-turn-helix transcriptional regulator [Flavobacteriaceae bacterium]